MEIMLNVAELNDARELVPIKHVMIGNTGMMSIGGETGINFLVLMPEKMSAILSLSCMPHLVGAIPKVGDHVAYADSAPVIFANSYFGARSNRKSDIIALAAAISRRIPYFGYHLDEYRPGQVLVNVKARLKDDSDYDAMGYHVGRI